MCCRLLQLIYFHYLLSIYDFKNVKININEKVIKYLRTHIHYRSLNSPHKKELGRNKFYVECNRELYL